MITILKSSLNDRKITYDRDNTISIWKLIIGILGKWSFGPKDHEKFNVRSSMMTVLKSNCEDRNIKYDLEIRKRSWSKMQLCKSDLENHIRSRISNTILEIKYDLEVKYDLLKHDLEANYDLAKYDLENQIRSVFWRSEKSNTIMTAQFQSEINSEKWFSKKWFG